MWKRLMWKRLMFVSLQYEKMPHLALVKWYLSDVHHVAPLALNRHPGGIFVIFFSSMSFMTSIVYEPIAAKFVLGINFQS